LPPDYEPENDAHYMSEQMKRYFQSKLEAIKIDLQTKKNEIQQEVKELFKRESDLMDNGINEELIYQDASLNTHEDLMLQEIEGALQRIAEGHYGYCEVTKEPIGVQRLQRVPYARYCYEVQKEKEARK